MVLGLVGLMEFGCLWFSARYVRTAHDLSVLERTLSAGHQHRLQLWWRFAPLGVTLSAVSRSPQSVWSPAWSSPSAPCPY